MPYVKIPATNACADPDQAGKKKDRAIRSFGGREQALKRSSGLGHHLACAVPAGQAREGKIDFRHVAGDDLGDRAAGEHYISEHESDALPLAAPLNGTVVKHLVEVGSTVSKGDAVVIIEAMKMEYTLNAPHDGVLTSYCFAEGELVSHGDMLAIVEEPEA